MSGRRGPNQLVRAIESPIAAIAAVITISGMDITRPHCFVGVRFFADSGGAAEAVPTAGTVTISVQTMNTSPRFELIPISVIQALTPETLSWAANTLQVRATPSDVTVATHYRIVVTCNET